MDGDKKLLSMNTKALNTLYNALRKSNFNRINFNRITSCKNARDI